MMKVLVILVALLMLAGCASYAPLGVIYTEGRMGVQGGAGAAPKMGRACMNSYIGMVAIGDASLEAAKSAGGITDVVNMNYEVKNILGIYGEYCIVVYGR
jgi:hypothetical protein